MKLIAPVDEHEPQRVRWLRIVSCVVARAERGDGERPGAARSRARAARRYQRSIAASARRSSPGTSSSSPRRCTRVRPRLAHAARGRGRGRAAVAARRRSCSRTALGLRQPALDPRAQLDDGRRRGALGAAARQDDLDLAAGVDAHAHAAGAVGAADAVGQVGRSWRWHVLCRCFLQHRTGALHLWRKLLGIRVSPDAPPAARCGDDAADTIMGACRSIVPLPPGVRAPFEVYVNGVHQDLSADYVVRDGALVFERELRKEGKLGVLALVPGRMGRRDVPPERLGRRALRASTAGRRSSRASTSSPGLLTDPAARATRAAPRSHSPSASSWPTRRSSRSRCRRSCASSTRRSAPSPGS